jgi:glutamine cyclotransferase
MGFVVFALAMLALFALSIAFAIWSMVATMRRERAIRQQMAARIAHSRELYQQGLAATTDAERGRVIDELLKD